MRKIITIKNRIYSDYFMPSRLKEYNEMINQLCINNYEHITFRDYKKVIDSGLNKDKKYSINRHDIDTAKEFFKIEKKYGVKASYYFRLSTLDFPFMKELEAYGIEASYHFEETAQYCKDNHIKSKDEVINQMPKIKEQFILNFKMIENKLGYKLSTVCFHGDFVNRKLEIVNNEITKDINLRKELNLSCETYDKDIMNSFDIYVSDRPYPIFYYPKSIFEYIGDKNIICQLSHPRQWRINIIVNTLDNIKRVCEGLKW